MNSETILGEFVIKIVKGQNGTESYIGIDRLGRCRYCEHYELAGNGYNGFCERNYASFTADDYCSYWAKKESES